MMPDEAIPELHDLDEIELLAVGADSGIFPDQPVAVGEEAMAMALPLRRLGTEDLLHEGPQCLSSLDDAAFAPQQMADEGAFEGAVLRVEGHRRIDVFLPEGIVPSMINALRRFDGGAIGR